MSDLQRGVVKWFNDAKGFGFIEHTSGRDVFVHYSVIDWDGFKTLKDGEEVEYELSEGDKGLHAAKVLRKIAKPAATAIVGPRPLSPEGAEPSAFPMNADSMSELLEIEQTSAQTVEDVSRPPENEEDSSSVQKTAD